MAKGQAQGKQGLLQHFTKPVKMRRKLEVIRSYVFVEPSLSLKKGLSLAVLLGAKIRKKEIIDQG